MRRPPHLKAMQDKVLRSNMRREDNSF